MKNLFCSVSLTTSVNLRKSGILTLFTMLLFVASAVAQKKGTTDDGKRVILNQDGTWKYDDAPKTDQPRESYLCSDIIERRADKVTGDVSFGIKDPVIVSRDNKNGFVINILKSKDGVLLLIIRAVAADAGSCIEDNGKMNILFRDETRMEVINSGKFNCDSEFTLYLGGGFGHKKELELFKSKEIATMRVWTSKAFVQEDFPASNSKAFMSAMICITQ